VLAYYYRGLPSWSWYFPFHYAPLATDLGQFLCPLPNAAVAAAASISSS
jgi:hypothetical protein